MLDINASVEGDIPPCTINTTGRDVELSPAATFSRTKICTGSPLFAGTVETCGTL